MIELELIQRALNAWDATPLPKASDGLMQEVMEDLRAALAPAGTVADWYAAGMDYAYTEATDPSSGDEWATQDVAKAFAAGARLALRAATVAPAEPITVEAVAEVRDTDDGLTIDWLIEGGIDAMVPGCVLVCATRPITDDKGQGEVYLAPVAPVDHDEFALFRNDLCDFLRHVIDMGKGDHYWDVVRGNAGALLRRVDRVAPVAPADPAMVSALRFYAQRQHFVIADGDAWDTVSGEPPNYWCDDAGTATVEDGSIARIALEGKAAPAAPAPVPLTGEQLLRVAGSTAYLHAYDALRAVEAAHGIKP